MRTKPFATSNDSSTPSCSAASRRLGRYGKSTLIGRLALLPAADSSSTSSSHIARASRDGATTTSTFALLTDGLLAEREQGLTIRLRLPLVRHAAPPFPASRTLPATAVHRTWSTRASNAGCGGESSSTRAGVSTQPPPLLLVSSRLPHVVYSFTEYLVEFSESALRRDGRAVPSSARIVLHDPGPPVSALKGDSVVDRTDSLPLVSGSAARVPRDGRASGDRHHATGDPVVSGSCPYRTPPRYRGYAGQVAGANWPPGTKSSSLPSGLRTYCCRIEARTAEARRALPGQS